MTSLTEDLKYRPYGLPLMLEAWLGCVHWAIGQPEIRDAFRRQEGRDLSVLLNRAPMAQMIDEATGRDREILISFCDWVTVHFWGVEGDEIPDEDA